MYVRLANREHNYVSLGLRKFLSHRMTYVDVSDVDVYDDLFTTSLLKNTDHLFFGCCAQDRPFSWSAAGAHSVSPAVVM